MNSFLAIATDYNRLAGWGSRQARRLPPLAVLLDAWNAYRQDEMPLLAAALSYYSLLSHFPLLLLLIVAASPFLAEERVVNETLRFVQGVVPTGGAELRRVLTQVLDARGPATLVGALGLVWSASGAFDVMQRAMNRIWRVPRPRPFWAQRLVSLGVILGLVILFGGSLAISAATRSSLAFRPLRSPAIAQLIGVVASIALNLALFAIVYRVFPNAPIHFGQIVGGALVAGVLWEIAKLIFVWYLTSFAHLNLVYGSVGAIIAILTWGYITAVILFFGAELSAAQSRRGSFESSQIVTGPSL